MILDIVGAIGSSCPYRALVSTREEDAQEKADRSREDRTGEEAPTTLTFVGNWHWVVLEVMDPLPVEVESFTYPLGHTLANSCRSWRTS